MPEIEIKLRVADLSSLLSKLDGLGWIAQGREYERNTLYDSPAHDLLQADKMLRIRETAGKTIVTVKGPAQPGGPHKVREERETEAADAAQLQGIFDLLGYRPAWVYEKYRTRFTRQGEPGVIEVDETPIGDVMELEGPPEWIDRTAAELGYSRDDYVTGSYRDLFVAWKQEFSRDQRDMVFDSPAGSAS